jgi:hypothetical protein
MKLKYLKPHSLTYFLSIMLGLMMFMVVIVSFLRFAKGNIVVAISLAVMSTLLLGMFLSWVDIQSPPEEEKEKNNSRHFSRRRL